MVGWWTHSPTGLRFDILEAAQQAAQQDSSRSSSTSTKRPWLISRLSKDFVPPGLFLFLLGKGQSPTKTSGISCERALLSLVASCDTSLRLTFAFPSPCCSFFCSIHFCQMGGELESRDLTEGRKAAGFLFFNCLFWSLRSNFCQTQWIALPNIFMSSEKSWLNDVFRPTKMMSFAKCWSAGSQGFAWREHVKSPSNGLPWTEIWVKQARSGWCVSCIKLWSSVTGLSYRARSFFLVRHELNRSMTWRLPWFVLRPWELPMPKPLTFGVLPRLGCASQIGSQRIRV